MDAEDAGQSARKAFSRCWAVMPNSIAISVTMTMIFIYTLAAKRPIADVSCVKCSSKMVQRYTIQKKTLKHENIIRPKITAGLSTKLSIDVAWLMLMETVGYKRLVLLYMRLGEDRKWWTVLQR